MLYTPFISDIDVSFYSSLAAHKLDHDKLDDSARNILGYYDLRSADSPEISCRLQIPGNALNAKDVPQGSFRAEGMIKNFNTSDEYYSSDKAALLQEAGRKVWDAIDDGSIYSSPSLLSSFLIICFADLKKYRVLYWFAFPALQSHPSWVATEMHADGQASDGSLTENVSSSDVPDRNSLVDAVTAWRSKVDPRQHGFFLAKRDLQHRLSNIQAAGPLSPGPKNPWQVSELSSFEAGFFTKVQPENCYVCFVDPSNYAGAPGWMLRNLLVLIRQRWKLEKVQLIRYRDTLQHSVPSRSQVITLKSVVPVATHEDSTGASKIPKVLGWERNESGKLSGRAVDLTEHMDPRRVADQAVDLNLKLMKWRIAPSLDLEVLKPTKCLLLGAGTLGCNVARNLLGWGFRTITFVDSGLVSFSNPVRQSLFEFQDCGGRGTRKATRAAERLSEIYPGVHSEGHVLSIPMVGHPIINEAAVKHDFERLKELVDKHDAIFLLTDTRESRWLPTVMGKAAGKLVMNAALGFDTYVAMRHGNFGSDLGCYFCNDIVAPTNSTRAQTLDQQCTVTRPGVAVMASALLVELFVSVLQKEESSPNLDSRQTEEQSTHPLGIIPHQIRGFLSTFSNTVVTGQSYEYCSACSDKVLQAYSNLGWDFVRDAVNEIGYIEELSGLKKVQEAAEQAATLLELEFSDSEAEL